MPYISPEQRSYLDNDIDALIGSLFMREDATVGSLNYILTRLVHGFLGDSPRYADLNGAIGVLECAKLELYRRIVAPYEDTKIAENGDVR